MTIRQAVLVLSLVSMVCGETALCQTGTLVRNQSAGIPFSRVPDTGQQTHYTPTFGEDSDYTINAPSFSVNGDGTVTDNVTGLQWQETDGGEMTYASAVTYCDTLVLGSNTDWRLPSAHELFGILHHDRLNPALDTSFFTKSPAEYWWSSDRRAGDAADLDTVSEVLLPGGQFEMGDHHGFVDPSHPSDELPIHAVRVNSFIIARTETPNQLICDLLNLVYGQGVVEVRGNCVFLTGGADTLLYLNPFASYSSIGFSGGTFSIVDFRARHPVVGIMWVGAAASCNWLSIRQGLQPCYDTGTWRCDFTKNGYRLPTEAEWEYAGRGGQVAPYYNYPWGDDQDVTKANWPGSEDPYETGAYPYTTPVGFYDGALKQRGQFTWPGSTTSYQTSLGANAFGLYDMAGNVWEFVNDWYGNSYYSVSPFDNPKGPDSGFIMPDGKPYRGMRGGNWYNGYTTTSVNDGHSRVSNRNPSYYRGPQDPNHPWYHVGFRVARNAPSPSGVGQDGAAAPVEYHLCQNFPNPFNSSTTIRFTAPASGRVRLAIYDLLGRETAVLVDGETGAGTHAVTWDATGFSSGVYFCRLTAGDVTRTTSMLLTK